jgi:hypothetical protein
MKINYTSLVFKLGRLLNKRVYVFPFNREQDTQLDFLNKYHSILKECKENKHVALTLPEYCLSFKLKTIELCRNENTAEAKKILEIEDWINCNAKDILDESDEILSVKYQLVYSVGLQKTLDGGKLRWEIPQYVLKLAEKHLEKLNLIYPTSIEFKKDNDMKQTFASIRLLNIDHYEELIRKICFDFFNKIDVDPDLPQFVESEIYYLIDFVVKKTISPITVSKINEMLRSNETESPVAILKETLLILRGILAYDILYFVLNKRWKVEYGINTNINLMQAVPFKAKDVPTERSQFAHPDIAILLTYLSYYYDGLNDSQFSELIILLENDSNGSHQYNKWISLLPNDVKINASVKEFSRVNFSDSNQRNNVLYPLLKKHPPVINDWLSNFLFPKEAKEFSFRLSASAWDLASLNTNLTTGFSGTNDSSRYLSPLTINYYDLPNLFGTTGMVMQNILCKENSYTCLKTNDNEEEILKLLIEQKINVLLDVGALMIKYSNKKLAQKWLNLIVQKNKDTEIEAVVFFEDNELVLIQKNSIEYLQSFETSIYINNLKKCLIYLDDIHTRGTDLKIPSKTSAVVTLGKGLTKDRLFQACMRMRMLGDGHKVKFLASKEVNCEIIKNISYFNNITSHEVLQWTINNSIKNIKNDSIYWAHQGLSFFLKKASYESYVNLSKESNVSLYFETSKEKSSNELKSMYGNSRIENLITDIINIQSTKLLNNFQVSSIEFNQFSSNTEKISNKLKNQIPDLKKFDQLFDEEIELEIEKEVEEEVQIERPVKAKECKPELNEDIVKFVTTGVVRENSIYMIKLMKSLVSSSFYDLVEENAWSNHILVSRDFCRTVEILNFSDYFLRMPRWIAIKKSNKKNDNLFLIISSYEADRLFFCFKEPVGLFMFIPRVTLEQKIISYPRISLEAKINVQISLFFGSIYFKDKNEEINFNKFVGYLPAPRNKTNQEKFDKKIISSNGYVNLINRKYVFVNGDDVCEFEEDPSRFIIKLIENRNFERVPKFSHHLKIFLNGKNNFE